MSKVIQGPSPLIYLLYLEVGSNLRSTKHTRCHYFTLSQPGNSHLSKMAASQYPKRVLWICDAVIDMTVWVYYRLKKHVHSCSLTTKVRISDNAFNEFNNTRYIVYTENK